MSPGSRLRVSDKLLIAALGLHERARVPFSAEDLVVSAWVSFPETFGLSGYFDKDGRPIHPDSNRVFAEIMGSKPLRRQGYMVKTGSKMYQLTESGLSRARFLASSPAESHPPNKIRLSREARGHLSRLLQSRAVTKYREGRIADLTFHDACTFWGVSPRSTATVFSGRLNNFLRLLDMARKAISDRDSAFQHGGAPLTNADLDALAETHTELCNRFQEDTATIMRRTDERV